MKTTEQIAEEYRQLSSDLYNALSTFEHKDTIRSIREKILENQKSCTHFSKILNFSIENGYCPYCGKKIFN